MVEIKLKNAQSIFVDEEDEAYLVAIGGWYVGGDGYAITDKVIDGKRTIIRMHRLITQVPSGVKVDHIDMNRLNNCRNNLRFATQAQNLMNRGAPKNNTSGYKGVSWHTQNRNWRASINLAGKFISLGSFSTKEDAAKAYNEGALKYHGEFARLNKIEKVIHG